MPHVDIASANRSDGSSPALAARTIGSSMSTASRTGAIPARLSITTVPGSSAARWSGGSSRSVACRSGSNWTASFGGLSRGAGIEQSIGIATVFASGGIAAARIENSVTDIDFGPNMPTRMDPDDSFRDGLTETGWVIGLGVEVPLADAWTLRLEASYLKFGRNTHYVNRSGNNRCGPGNPRRPCPYNIENNLGIVRFAIIYRFAGS